MLTMHTILSVFVVVLCITTSGEAVFSTIDRNCDAVDGCMKTCELGITATCSYGMCVCDIDAMHGGSFIHDLRTNIDRYLTTYYTRAGAEQHPRHKVAGVESRHKRSLDVLAELPRKIVPAHFTFEEARINKRSVRNYMSTPDQDILQTLQTCSANITDENNHLMWFHAANTLKLRSPMEEDTFFRQWNDIITPFNQDTMKLGDYSEMFPPLSVKDVVSGTSVTAVYQRLFWPFNLEITLMNQKLALLGLTGEIVPSQVQKSAFYSTLSQLQDVDIPVVERKIVYSFDNMDLAKFISGKNSENDLEQYIFSADEQKTLTSLTDAALELINETIPDLYRSMTQLVGCIGFYKGTSHISATMYAAIGVIWLDPSKVPEWNVPFFAEHIVHEYIHMSLFMAEMVHGMFKDYDKLNYVQVMSSIRRVPRDYDRSFHACYVSTGLVAFHAKAGFWTRAQVLAEDINTPLDELIATNEASDLLTPAGKATIDAMNQFVTIIRLKE